jgi:hypothetical protein
MRAQETQEGHGAREKEKREGQGRQAKEEHVPPLQEIPPQEAHRVKPDKCMWNIKYKGYHFKSICNELEVDFKPRITFLADLGGYAEKDDSGSE